MPYLLIRFLFIILFFSAFQFYRPSFFEGYSDLSKYLFEFVSFILLTYSVFFTGAKFNIRRITWIGFVLLFISMFSSIFMANKYNGQAYIQGLTSTLPYFFSYASFFIFLGFKLPPAFIERCIKYFAITTMILMILNLALYPVALFGRSEIAELRGGLIRVRVSGVLFITFFLLQNIQKFTLFKKRKYVYWVILSAFFILLSLTRQLILLSLICGALLYFNKVDWKKKLVFSCIVLLIGLFVIPQLSIVKKFADYSEEQINNEDSNIRYMAWDYYTKEMQPDPQCYIWGTGVPNANSNYGKQFYEETTALKVFFVDIGYGGFFFFFGTVGIVGLLLILLSAFSYKCLVQFQYVKYFYAIALLSSFTNGIVFYKQQVLLLMISLYLLTVKYDHRYTHFKL